MVRINVIIFSNVMQQSMNVFHTATIKFSVHKGTNAQITKLLKIRKAITLQRQAGAVSSHPMMPKIPPSPLLLLQRHIWSCLCRFCDTYGLCQLSNRFQAPLLWHILAPLDLTIFSHLFLSLESALNWRQALAKPQYSFTSYLQKQSLFNHIWIWKLVKKSWQILRRDMDPSWFLDE